MISTHDKEPTLGPRKNEGEQQNTKKRKAIEASRTRNDRPRRKKDAEKLRRTEVMLATTR
jgi:hypothetical protein